VPTRPHARASSTRRAEKPAGPRPRACDGREHKAKQRRSYRRRCSIAPTLLNQQIRSRQDAVPKNLFGACGKIRPLARGDPSGTMRAMTRFRSRSSTVLPAQPGLQPLGVPKLANATICVTLSSWFVGHQTSTSCRCRS
jgi:hypothetical protein